MPFLIGIPIAAAVTAISVKWAGDEIEDTTSKVVPMLILGLAAWWYFTKAKRR